LLNQCSILLGDAFDVRNRIVDAVDGVGLFSSGAGDLGVHGGDSLDRFNNSAHGLACGMNFQGARLHPLDLSADQGANLFGCRRAALRRHTHFADDDGESAPLFAGTGPPSLH